MEGKRSLFPASQNMLDKELCDKLVRSASLAIGHNVLITDVRGYVLSSDDSKRVGTLHEASVEVIETGQKAYHDSAAAKRLSGTMPGMTIPLFMDELVVGTIGITGSPQEISRYAVLLQQMYQIFLSFQNQQQASVQMDYQKQILLREIVTFDKRTRNATVIYESAYEMGVDLNLCRAVILVQRWGWEHGSPATEDLAQHNAVLVERVSGLFCRRQDFICMQNETECVALAQVRETGETDEQELLVENCRKLEREMRQNGQCIRVGIGSLAHSLQSLRTSYENACFAARILQTGIRRDSCLSVENVVLEKLAANLPQDVCEEAEREIFQGVLSAKKSEEILEVIDHWCQSRFNFEETARTLHIHKSTLNYRFQRIQQLCGLDMRDFDRVMALYLLNVRRKLNT